MFFQKRINRRRSRISVTSSSTTDVGLPLHHAEASQTNLNLSLIETVVASLFLFCWLLLFAGGIVLDTTQYRCAISGGGTRSLAVEARPGDDEAKNICKQYESWVPVGYSSISGEKANAYRLVVAWFVVLLFFLPLNLAVVSAAAGALGAIGNKANLEADLTDAALQNSQIPTNPNLAHKQARDNSSPIMSGLLRGLFIYLFFISGLLLFDDKPFSSPGPGQYIRFAGFLSLISFLINYRPYLFSTISDWAFDRINAREVVPARANQQEIKEIALEEERAELNKEVPPVAVNGKKNIANGRGEQEKLQKPVTAALKEFR